MGYAGRVAVVESLSLDDDLRAALMADHPLHDIEIEASAVGPMTPFRRYASLLMTRRIIAPRDALPAVAG